MQDGSNPKQLIAEKIKQSANILVTVSANPSVDSLTAALGLTLMLNKLDKHATAVFSGVIPPAINFLEPGKTFENNVDSLRDFIIALDKEKADRLRYKVEDDVVRIFITPYRTKISDKDLQFSQGDFNVDLIVALGVEDQKDLDQAITAHGRILHDATVVTINATNQKSSLGSIDWQNGNASSLSEMLASLAELLKSGLLDQQISTSLLTGIVASTERFSNQHTTPQVMTVAAQLMAAGANQQLIATKLQTIPAPVSPRREKPKQDNRQQNQPKKQEEETKSHDGEMHIQHDKPNESMPPTPVAEQQQEPEAQPEPTPELSTEPESQQPEPEAPEELAIAPPAVQNFDDLKQAINDETIRGKSQREMADVPPTPGDHNINDEKPEAEAPKPEEDESYLSTHPSWQGREIKPPTMGGTLNATAEQALEDKQREETEEKRNHKILSHGGSAANGSGSGNGKGQKQRQKKSREQRQSQKPDQQQAQPAPKRVEEPAAAPAPEPTAPETIVQPEPPVEAPALAQPEPVAPPEPAVSELPPIGPAPVEQPQAPEAPLEPASQKAPQPQAEIPVAPPPLVVSEPLAPSAPSESPEVTTPAPMPEPALPPEPQPTQTQPEPAGNAPTLEELEREVATHAAQSPAPQTLTDLEAERKQVEPTVGSTVVPPVPQASQTPGQPPAIPGLPPMPPMPDFSTLPPLPNSPAPQQNATGAAPNLDGAPANAPQRAFPELPQLPSDEPPQNMPQAPTPPTSPPPPQAPTDPAQFKIPGAQ